MSRGLLLLAVFIALPANGARAYGPRHTAPRIRSTGSVPLQRATGNAPVRSRRPPSQEPSGRESLRGEFAARLSRTTRSEASSIRRRLTGWWQGVRGENAPNRRALVGELPMGSYNVRRVEVAGRPVLSLEVEVPVGRSSVTVEVRGHRERMRNGRSVIEVELPVSRDPMIRGVQNAVLARHGDVLVRRFVQNAARGLRDNDVVAVARDQGGRVRSYMVATRERQGQAPQIFEAQVDLRSGGLRGNARIRLEGVTDRSHVRWQSRTVDAVSAVVRDRHPRIRDVQLSAGTRSTRIAAEGIHRVVPLQVPWVRAATTIEGPTLQRHGRSGGSLHGQVYVPGGRERVSVRLDVTPHHSRHTHIVESAEIPSATQRDNGGATSVHASLRAEAARQLVTNSNALSALITKVPGSQDGYVDIGVRVATRNAIGGRQEQRTTSHVEHVGGRYSRTELSNNRSLVRIDLDPRRPGDTDMTDNDWARARAKAARAVASVGLAAEVYVGFGSQYWRLDRSSGAMVDSAGPILTAVGGWDGAPPRR